MWLRDLRNKDLGFKGLWVLGMRGYRVETIGQLGNEIRVKGLGGRELKNRVIKQ